MGQDLRSCYDVMPVDLDTMSRFISDDAGSSNLFTVETDSAGFLAIHAATPLGSEAEPRLRFLGADCRAGALGKASFEAIHYVAGEEIQVPAPGAYYVEVSSQDPALALGDFKLIVGFAGEDTNNPGAPMKDGSGEGETESDEVDETIPMYFECPDAFPFAVSTKDGSGEGETESDEVDETIPAFAGCLEGPDLSQRLDLCRRHRGDDFGDMFTCAALLTPDRTVHGEIRNDWRDDQDVFALIVADWRRLRIEARGDFEIRAALYDHQGQGLVPSYSSDGGGSPALTRALAPGIYFLRIDGSSGAQGTYSLTVEEAGW